jgi:HAD superfamily hydrolase (TIGR01509 family)
MIRAVIFDFNGILADDDPIHMQALREVADEERLTFSEDEYMETYLPLNDRDCFRLLLERNGRSAMPDEIDRLIRRKSDKYFGAIAEKDVLFAGAADAITAAASRGPVAIASGARRGEIRHILGGAGLLDCFSTIVAMEDVRRGKPDPEPFRIAFDRLKQQVTGLLPDECAAVEDSLGGIQSAHSAGLSCLGIAHSYPRGRLEAAKPRWVIDSISDFAEWLNRV